MSKHHNPPQRNSMMPVPNPSPRPDAQAAPDPMRVAYVVHRDHEGWQLRLCRLPESLVAQHVERAHPADVYEVTAARVQQDLDTRCIGGER